MVDQESSIRETFHQYATTFEALDPATVLPFYHYPAILIAGQKPIRIANGVVGFGAFKIVMLKLKSRGYDHSETKDVQVRQLRDDLAIVTGTVIRYKKDRVKVNDTELERFDLNYTMRKIDNHWKIIVGALYDIDNSAPELS